MTFKVIRKNKPYVPPTPEGHQCELPQMRYREDRDGWRPGDIIQCAGCGQVYVLKDKTDEGDIYWIWKPVGRLAIWLLSRFERGRYERPNADRKSQVTDVWDH